MTTKFQFELFRALRHRKGVAKGFTLIELLIVVAIIGLLAALGIPKYLDIRANAQAGAAAGEAVGLGKECAVYLASGGVGTNPSETGYAGLTGTNTCALATGGNFVRDITNGNSGVKCIDQVSSRGKVRVTVNVTTTGVISCSFS